MIGHVGFRGSLREAIHLVLSSDRRRGHMTCTRRGRDWPHPKPFDDEVVCTDGRDTYSLVDCGKLCTAGRDPIIQCVTVQPTPCPDPSPSPTPTPGPGPGPTPGPTPSNCPAAAPGLAPCCNPQGVRLLGENARDYKLGFGLNCKFPNVPCNDERKTDAAQGLDYYNVDRWCGGRELQGYRWREAPPGSEIPRDENSLVPAPGWTTWVDGRQCEPTDLQVTWSSSGNIHSLEQHGYWLHGKARKGGPDAFSVTVCLGDNVDQEGQPIQASGCVKREYRLSEIKGIQ